MADTKEKIELEKVKAKLESKEEVIKEQKKLTKTATTIAKQAAKNLKHETRKQTTTAIVAGFGFLIALVWRDAIKGYVDYIAAELSFQGPELLVAIYTAIITTFIAVIGIVIITRIGKDPEEKSKIN